MLSIIGSMLLGIFAGFLGISRDESGKALRIIGKIQQIATMMLLFVMGVWLGGNPDFWNNIQITGLRGFVFAAACILGSVFAVHFFAKLAFYTKKTEDRQ